MRRLLKAIAGIFIRAANAVLGLFGTLKVPPPPPRQTHRKDFSARVIRADDLLVLTLDFYNAEVVSTPNGQGQLKRRGPGDTFIVVHFPAQSFGEEALGEDGDPEPAAPVGFRIAGPSQIVFRVADTLLPLSMSTEALLAALANCEQYVQSTVRWPPPVPRDGGTTEFGGQHGQFTAIEAPYRMFLSPSVGSRWSHASEPVYNKAGTHVELWHTRLSKDATVRVVASHDYSPPRGPASSALFGPRPVQTPPFPMSLTPEHRHTIVRSTADPRLFGAQPAAAYQLMLSSQGAWLDLHGQWDTRLGLAEWRHIMTAGRDQQVKVVEEGYLFPYGQRAVFVTITERRVQMALTRPFEGSPIAYLRQRKFIVVREPVRAYRHRHLPFRTVTIKTVVTPNIQEDFWPVAGSTFWPQELVDGKAIDFHFHLVGTDWDGRQIEFHAPLAFVGRASAENAAAMKNLVDAYNKIAESDGRRQRPMGLTAIAFAPRRAGSVESGDTSLDADAMIFGAAPANAYPAFLPTMAKARVDIPAIRNLGGPTTRATIALDPTFTVAAGETFGNMAEVFAYLVDQRTSAGFPVDRTGGLANSAFEVSGLSRAFGPFGGDPRQFADGMFRPDEMFKGAKLFGTVDLGKIIAHLDGVTPASAGDAVPRLKTVRTVIDGDDVFATTYRWSVAGNKLLHSGAFAPQPDATFTIDATHIRPVGGSASTFEVKSSLTNFVVTLIPTKDGELVKLTFKKITFDASPGRKLDFSIEGCDVSFVGMLHFVDDLRKVLPSNGFSDPPSLRIISPPDPRAGVHSGFSLGIPSIGLGLFSLQNVSISAGFYLPFLGPAANLRLAFCERHQPFLLTVSLFGGGGFFAVDIGLDRVTQVEAAFEFGACVALDLGVAKGTAYVMGGIYYQKSGADFILSGYFRAGGSLSVLGVITVSVELYLALSYQSDKAKAHGGKVWGQASLTVKVKILFFSTSVRLAIEREFAGSDPKLEKMMTEREWGHYLDMFDDAYAA